MDEKQFEQGLLDVIQKYKLEDISEEDFVESLQDLAKQVEPQQIDEFNDEELGWAKTWIDEISHYGISEVMGSKFNFFDFLVRRNNQSVGT